MDFICFSDADCNAYMRWIQLLILAFFAILFLQSGLDKVFDFRGNLEWLGGHFADTFLSGMVTPMVLTITLAELAAGALCAVGLVLILVTGSATLGFFGVLLSGISLIMLFFGQRIAKDYPGAAVLVPYFITALIGLYVFSLS